LQRRAVRDHHYRSQQADFFGHGGGVGKAGQLIQAPAAGRTRPVAAFAIGVAAVDFMGDHDVVADAEIGQTHRLGVLGESAHPVRGRHRVARADMHSKIHVVSP